MKFTTGETISAGTGKLCCPMEGVYRILNFLTGDNLYTHQLPRAFHACEAWVQQQHPWLSQLDTTACTPTTWRQFLADAEERFGKEHELQPLSAGQYESTDPVLEALEMFPAKDVTVVITDRKGDRA